jgi:hypothetical protein
MNQLSLIPASHRNDPWTSDVAEEEITASGARARQQEIALGVVIQHPGCTSLELAEYCSLDRYQLAKRLPEIRRQGKVKNGMKRMCRVGNRPAVTWWVV